MPIDLPPWPGDVPADAIRAEVRAMADAWVEVLTAVLPAGAIRGLYLKGSANRSWDSAIDYVPGRSDVDLHLGLRSPEDEHAFDELAFALDVAARVERAYRARVPNPLHHPRPQLTFMSALHARPGYLPSPPATVTTLAGEPAPALTLDDAARAAVRDQDRKNLLAHSEFVAALPRRAVDRPGGLVAGLADELLWRVSPVAPRVLSLAGERYEVAWSLNRTTLVRRLEARGHDALARAYAEHYLAGWRVFRATRAGDAELRAAAARDMLVSGVDAMRLGIAFAEAAAR